VQFVDASHFLTLDNHRELNLRKFPDGEITSQVFVFAADVDKAKVFFDDKIVFGLQDSNNAYFAKLGAMDNSVQYGSLRRNEFLLGAKWFKDDVVFLQTIYSKEDISLKIDDETYRVIQKDGKAWKLAGIFNLDDQSNNPWTGSIKKMFSVSESPSYEALEKEDTLDKSLPGTKFINVAGDPNIVSRQVKDKIFIVEKNSKRVLLTLSRGGAEIASIWAGKGGQRIAIGSQDGKLRLWDMNISKSEIVTLNAHGSEVKTIIGNPSETLLLSADGNGRVRIWPLLTKEQLVAATKAAH